VLLEAAISSKVKLIQQLHESDCFKWFFVVAMVKLQQFANSEAIKFTIEAAQLFNN